MASIENPYAGIDLFLLSDVHARVESLVSRSSNELAPFERQIDFWWAGIGIGVALGHRTPTTAAVTKFNTGIILNSDPWRITHLELLALSEEGAEAISVPNRVIRIASEYANTGTLWLSNKLVGEPEPILTLVNLMGEFYRQPKSLQTWT